MKKNKLTLAIITALIPTTSAIAEQTSTEDIERIEIKGRAQQFYLDANTKVGTKVDAALIDIPMSVDVITNQLITDQAARDITDLYRSIAGVSEFSYSGVTFRGFRDDGNVFYDGVRGDPYSGFSVPQVFNVERIEVLKGPSSALYGGGEPGGMINYVTKKPTFTEKKQVNITAGTDNLFGGSFEATGGLTDDIAYRFGAFQEKEDSIRDNADSENTQLAGGLLFALSDVTTLTTTFDYVDQNLGGARLRGVPVDDEGNFLVDPSYNANEKSDYQDLEALTLQANLNHDFSDYLNMNTTLRYMDNERSQAYHESRGWVDTNGDGEKNADDGEIEREYRDQFRANEEISLTVDFVYESTISEMNNQFLFGGDYHDQDTEYDYLKARGESAGVLNLNVFEPNYGETDPASYNLVDQDRDGMETNRYGLYVQNVITINDKWTAMAGVRFDQFEETNKENGNTYDDNGVTYRTGLTYKPIEDIAIYVNYSESFDPVSANDFENGAEQLEPTTGDQIEIGIKKEWLNGRIFTTLAFYQIDKENLVINNPDYDEESAPHEPKVINYGLIESDGVEFTLVGDLTENISITANYAYNDTQIVKGDTSNDSKTGDMVNTPDHQAGLWVRYDLSQIDSSVAFGANYVGEQISFDDQKVKAYTVFDASWNTHWDEVQLALNVKNLFNKEYAVSGFSERNGHFPGAPRQVVAQVTYNF